MVSLRRGSHFGRYRVGSLLARGGFANVYRAVDGDSGRRVALKVPVTRYPDAETAAAYQREAAENQKLRHTNVLPVLDTGVVGGVPYLVTPLGLDTVADHLGGPLPLRKALRWTHEMLLALAHAHGRHVIHCDVKPENLVRMPGGRIALADFGAARRGHRTVLGDGTGTPGYMAPEQARGRPSARSDVYAAGIVLATLLFGPLPGGRIPEQHPRLRKLPTGLLDLVERAIDPEPSRRFGDARQMLQALRRIERRVRAKSG